MDCIIYHQRCPNTFLCMYNYIYIHYIYILYTCDCKWLDITNVNNDVVNRYNQKIQTEHTFKKLQSICLLISPIDAFFLRCFNSSSTWRHWTKLSESCRKLKAEAKVITGSCIFERFTTKWYKSLQWNLLESSGTKKTSEVFQGDRKHLSS